jgi:hypothetical protein
MHAIPTVESAVAPPELNKIHAAVMVRFEETPGKRIADVLRRIPRRRRHGTRLARRCDVPIRRQRAWRKSPETNQFVELGRFAVMQPTTFAESPSVTPQRDPQK